MERSDAGGAALQSSANLTRLPADEQDRERGWVLPLASESSSASGVVRARCRQSSRGVEARGCPSRGRMLAGVGQGAIFSRGGGLGRGGGRSHCCCCSCRHRGRGGCEGACGRRSTSACGTARAEAGAGATARAEFAARSPSDGDALLAPLGMLNVRRFAKDRRLTVLPVLGVDGSPVLAVDGATGQDAGAVWCGASRSQAEDDTGGTEVVQAPSHPRRPRHAARPAPAGAPSAKHQEAAASAGPCRPRSTAR